MKERLVYLKTTTLILSVIIISFYWWSKNRLVKAVDWIEKHDGKLSYIDNGVVNSISPNQKELIRKVVGYKEVSVKFSKEIPKDFMKLNEIPKLVEVSFEGNSKIETLDLSSILDLKLKRFQSDYHIEDISKFKKYRQLESLSLRNRKFNLSLLGSLDSIKYLYLANQSALENQSNQDFSKNNLPNLEILRLENFKLSNLEKLKLSKSLTHIHLRCCLIKDFSFLDFTTKLKELRINQIKLGYNFFKYLPKFISKSPNSRIVIFWDDLELSELNKLNPDDLYEIAMHMKESGYTQEKVFIEFFKSAAKRKHILSTEELGILFIKNDIIPRNVAEAEKWFSRGAELGSNFCVSQLGLINLTGANGEKDTDLGLSMLEKAANKGHIKSAEILMKIFTNGTNDGIKADESRAEYWKQIHLELSE